MVPSQSPRVSRRTDRTGVPRNMNGIWRRLASVACRSGTRRGARGVHRGRLAANPRTAAATLALRRGSSGSERWLEARAAGGLGRGFAARGFRTDAALASDADATGASAGGGNVDYYSVKPAKGKNRGGAPGRRLRSSRNRPARTGRTRRLARRRGRLSGCSGGGSRRRRRARGGR